MSILERTMKQQLKKWPAIVAGTLAGALVAFSAQAKDYSSIRIAVDVPYEPFEYQLPDGTFTGFEVDLGNAVCADLKLECEWVAQGWDGIIPGLLARKYDVIFSSMSITEDRAKKVLFSDPYYITPSAWFAKDGTSIDPANKATLDGKRVGVQKGTIQDNYVTDFYKNVDTVVRYDKADELAVDLMGGRIDAVFLDFPVGEQTIINKDGYSQVGENVTTPLDVFGVGAGAAFRPRDKELAQMFNESLAKLKSNGVYDEIMNKYFTYSIKVD